MTKFIDAVDEDGNPCNFLSQIDNLKIEDLDNTSLNKVTTGSGFTSFLLESDVPYVVCVPFKSLITNKELWCMENGIEVLSVYGVSAGGATDKEISEFKGSKILVTWESLRRLVNALGDKVTDYRIAIDEAHKLTDSGAFRTDAIQDVIDLHGKFKAFVLGTATPISDSYMHSVFQNVPKIHIKWSNLQPVTVKYTVYEQDKLYKVGALIGMNHIKGITEGNAHIFINSVTSIAKIIKHMQSTELFDKSKIRIVASYSDKNREIFKNHKVGSFPISSINDEVRAVNFYTSTAFEGCDIYDEFGKTYVISDGTLDHTKIDITTQLPQIIGRIRDNKYKNQVDFLFSPNKYYTNLTKEEFEISVMKEMEDAKRAIYEHSCMVEMAKNSGFNYEVLITDFEKRVETDKLILYRDGEFILNELGCINELHNYDTINKLYYVPMEVKSKGTANGNTEKVYANTVDALMVHNDISYQYKSTEQIEIEGLNKKLTEGKVLFKDLCFEYIHLKSFMFVLSNRIEVIEAVEPIIKKAYTILGEDRMKALEYRKGNFQKELVKNSRINDSSWRIVQLLDYRVGQFVPANTLKERLQEIYDYLQIDKKAKATDIELYYNTKKGSKRIDSIVTKGFTIVFNRFVSE